MVRKSLLKRRINNRHLKGFLCLSLVAVAYIISVITSDSGAISKVRLLYGMNATAIEVAKETLPDGDVTRFSYSGIFSDTLADGESAFVFVSPGIYFVSEELPAGWLLDSINCNDNDSSGDPVSRTASYVVADGETVTCTFTNQKMGAIIVQKVTSPAGDPQSFEFTTDYGAPFQLSDGQNNDSGELSPGTYTVVETVAEGWVLENATCDDGSDPVAIDVSPGETVTCTFTNRKEKAIVVEKVTEPAGEPQAFDFTTDFGPPFQLSHGQQHDSGDLALGTYAITETLPSGWYLKSATCDDGSPPEAVELGENETVTCTFLNQKAGTIIVEKVVDPAAGALQSFEFTTDYGLPFQLSHGQSNNSGDLVPGTYAITETVPSGWVLKSAICDDGSEPGAVDLGAGETVTCTFHNQQAGSIVVEKVTDPPGNPQLFEFSTDYGPPFQLSHGQSNNSGLLAPGLYAVSETVPEGWRLASATCDDGSDPAAIDLGAGETVICTFVNQNAGNIIVKKVTDPAGHLQLFTFKTDFGTFQLGHGQSKDSGDLLAGTYTVVETLPEGWVLESASCDDGSDPGAIELSIGETVTCTFTNLKIANIIVRKVTDPAGEGQSFAFTPSYGFPFLLSHGQSNDSGTLFPGTYAVGETVPTGWFLTSAPCDDGSDPGEIILGDGETVTCTFHNQKAGTIIVEKVTDPAGDPQLFEFTTNYGLPFQLGHGQNNSSGYLLAGSYTVSETVPAGWVLESATCDDGSLPAEIDLGAGETVTCTFRNQKAGKIVVEKLTDPPGAPQLFDFTTDFGPPFQLGHGQSFTSGDLVPGTYAIEETVPPGWVLESATCDDGSSPSAVNVAVGETVTCTFLNQEAGTIIVEKITNPAGHPQAFTFTTDYSLPFQLSHGQNESSGDLAPGTYAVAETVPPGWVLESVSCDDGSDPEAISLGSGETVICTFQNLKVASVTIEKVTIPAGDPQVFTFTTGYGPPFQLGHGQINDSGELLPGTYAVSETEVRGWVLQSATCDDGSDPGVIVLDAGETVTCTFINRKVYFIYLPGLMTVPKFLYLPYVAAAH